ncbi:DDE_3 domain-containing protein [Trichonephila clavipes]|nr:DDE_3 domain-containing protein [Trichonephila clavipes]
MECVCTRSRTEDLWCQQQHVITSSALYTKGGSTSMHCGHHNSGLVECFPTSPGHIYRDVILQQHVRLFRGTMGAEFLFMDDNARPQRANIVDECLQSEDIKHMDRPT